MAPGPENGPRGPKTAKRQGGDPFSGAVPSRRAAEVAVEASAAQLAEAEEAVHELRERHGLQVRDGTPLALVGPAEATSLGAAVLEARAPLPLLRMLQLLLLRRRRRRRKKHKTARRLGPTASPNGEHTSGVAPYAF